MPKLFRALLIAVFACIAPGQASAHAVLLDADPSDGSVLASPPARATLRFNEPVTPVILRVLAPDGSILPLPSTPRAIDQSFIVDFPANLVRGTYLLSYRVISIDSHPVGGSLSFAVGEGRAGVAASPVAAAPNWDVAYSVLRALTMGALFFVLGGAVMRSFVLPADARATAAVINRLMGAAGPLAMAMAFLSLGVRGAQLADSPWSEFVTLTPWRIALSTAMAPGLACVLGGLLLGWLGPKRRMLMLLAVVVASAGLALTSHAALADPITLSFPAYLLHVAVVAFWLGSLPILFVALLREPLATAQAIVTRFSALAVWAVAGLILAGILLVLAQTGPDFLIWMGPVWSEGNYGYLLAGKLALVVGVLALALRNKRRLTLLLLRRKPEAPGLLRRAIVLEAIVMAAVIGIAAGLGSTVPPRSLAAFNAAHDQHATPDGGIVIEVVRNGVEILFEADPATPGPNQLTLHFLDDAKGVHLTPIEVRVSVALPTSGIEPLRRPAVPRGDGAYRVEDMPIPAAGVWQVRIEALMTDFDKLTATIDLPIGVAEK